MVTENSGLRQIHSGGNEWMESWTKESTMNARNTRAKMDAKKGKGDRKLKHK